tara:strand:+ start:3083 stop:4321 length:1239 start_codon:yes stop_codon:yes gene_type:complete
MPIKPRINSLIELEEMFKISLSKNAGITQWNSDSTIRNLYQPVAVELERLNRETSAVFNSLQFQYASGGDLERIGENFGINRMKPARAYANILDSNITFYTEVSFGSINQGANITIPKGTKIFAGTSENSKAVIYEVDSDYSLPAGGQRYSVGARAITIGSSQNIGARSLNFHEFTNYSDSISSALKVTNNFPILNGENIETDKSLRFKIYSKYSTLVRESRNSILIDAIEVPGVEDIKIAPGYYGVGTLGVFVFGPEGLVNQKILEEVGSRISAKNPPGTRLVVRNGISNYLDMEITLWVDAGLSSQIYSNYRRIATEEYLNFIKNNSRSNNINIDSLKKRIIQRMKNNVGVMSQQKENQIFDAVYLRKDYGEKLISSSERVRVITNNLILKDEEYLKSGILKINLDFINE